MCCPLKNILGITAKSEGKISIHHLTNSRGLYAQAGKTWNETT